MVTVEAINGQVNFTSNIKKYKQLQFWFKSDVFNKKN